MSVCVTIDGERVQFDRTPTDEDVAAWRELRKAITAALPELTAEQLERQEAARQRMRERRERLGITP